MRAAALALLLLVAATFASAQTGWIEGRVTDGGQPLPYANVLLDGTRIATMTDDVGHFRLRVWCGRFTLRVICMGYAIVAKPAVIRRDKTTRISFALEPVVVDRQEEEVVPRRRPASDPEYSQLENRKVDRVLESVARKYGVVGDWHYPASTEVVRYGDLDFSMRYVVAEQGDSVVVNVIAEGRNASDDPVAVCGCFSFWETRYQRGPDDFSQLRLRPASTPEPGTVFCSLDVPPLECDGSRFQATPRLLLPGETIARGMSFSFFPNAFREHPGELCVHGVFLRGHHGDAWEDTEFRDLGVIKVPIRPIGMPIRP